MSKLNILDQKTSAKLKLKARRMALDFINLNRQNDGMQKAKSISNLWWNMYGKEWLEKAAAK